MYQVGMERAPSLLWLLFFGHAHALQIADVAPPQAFRQPTALQQTTTVAPGFVSTRLLPAEDSRAVAIQEARTMSELHEVADLRLLVFSTFNATVRRRHREKSVQRMLERRRQGAECIVARHRGTGEEPVLGSIECSLMEHDPTALRAASAGLYLCDLCVHPRCRRQGIGTRLVSHAAELARSRGADALYLHVERTNHASVQLYQSSGFERVRDARFDHALGYRPGASLQLMRRPS